MKVASQHLSCLPPSDIPRCTVSYVGTQRGRGTEPQRHRGHGGTQWLMAIPSTCQLDQLLPIYWGFSENMVARAILFWLQMSHPDAHHHGQSEHGHRRSSPQVAPGPLRPDTTPTAPLIMHECRHPKTTSCCLIAAKQMSDACLGLPGTPSPGPQKS